MVKMNFYVLEALETIAFAFYAGMCYAQTFLEEQDQFREVSSMCNLNFDCKSILQLLCSLFGFGC